MERRKREPDEQADHEARHKLFVGNMPRLRELAREAAFTSAVEEFYVLCVDADDPFWYAFVDGLLSESQRAQLHPVRGRGKAPVLKMTARVGVRPQLLRHVEHIERGLDGPIPEGKARVVVLAAGGATVYDLLMADVPPAAAPN